MTATPTSRRRWPQILATVAVVVVLAIGGIIYFGSRAATPTATPTITSSPPVNSTTTADPAPTGCLGGSSRDAAMVLTAQKTAPHTTNGAVEVATAFTRWIQRFPYPDAAEAAKLSTRIMAKPSFTDDLTAYLAASPDLSGGIVPKGTNYYMSTVPGVWHLESGSADKVVASLGTGFVIDGTLSTTLRSSITVTLAWQGGVWKIADANGTRTTQELYTIGTAFTGGC
jgi:hypothetical protein